MDPENKKTSKLQRSDRQKAIAMTRAFDMLSEEFMENFAQTGKDTGPEGGPKKSPARDALAARDQREQAEQSKIEEKQEFRGFASLMAIANKPAKTSAFARLLSEEEPEPAQQQTTNQVPAPTPLAHAQPGTETTADGGIIKVKETVGKKRGLYTSCMQRPTLEQMQEAAVKFSRPNASSPSISPSSSATSSPLPSTPSLPPPEQAQASSPSPFSREAAASAGPSAPVQQAASQEKHSQSPQASSMRSMGQCTEKKGTIDRSKMTSESNCPIACAFGQVGGWLQNAFAWCKGKLGR
jgi:hypothetical protein